MFAPIFLYTSESNIHIFQGFGGPADLDNILSFHEVFFRSSQRQDLVPVTDQSWAWAAFAESNGSSVALSSACVPPVPTAQVIGGFIKWG